MPFSGMKREWEAERERGREKQSERGRAREGEPERETDREGERDLVPLFELMEHG